MTGDGTNRPFGESHFRFSADPALRTFAPASALQPSPTRISRPRWDRLWSRAEASKMRAQMASFAVDWDDPAMDIYNDSLQ